MAEMAEMGEVSKQKDEDSSIQHDYGGRLLRIGTGGLFADGGSIMLPSRHAGGICRRFR